MEQTDILKIIGSLGILIGPIGVIIGWLLARKSEQDREAKADKKKLKRTLFFLLEIRHQIVSSHLEEDTIDLVVETLKSKIPATDFPDTAHFKIFLTRLFNNLINSDILLDEEAERKSLKESFRTVVETLSEIDPLLAYRLNGKQNIKEAINKIELASRTTLADLVKEFAHPGSDPSVEVNQLLSNFTPQFLKDAIVELESITLEVGKRIDKKVLLATQQKLQAKLPIQNRGEIEQQVDKMLNLVGTLFSKNIPN